MEHGTGLTYIVVSQALSLPFVKHLDFCCAFWFSYGFCYGGARATVAHRCGASQKVGYICYEKDWCCLPHFLGDLRHLKKKPPFMQIQIRTLTFCQSCMKGGLFFLPAIWKGLRGLRHPPRPLFRPLCRFCHVSSYCIVSYSISTDQGTFAA